MAALTLNPREAKMLCAVVAELKEIPKTVSIKILYYPIML
jgi:hypothetical protein